MGANALCRKSLGNQQIMPLHGAEEYKKLLARIQKVE
jgi:hypothetical protein